MHKFLLGSPLLAKIPAFEKSNQVLAFSLQQIEDRQRNPVPRKDILNQLLDVHNNDPEALSLAEVIAITTTNVIAGSDTTAVTLASVIYYLSKYPEARQKLLDEMEHAQTHGLASNPITYAEAIKLPYLSAVINEAMRIHPATGFILERLVPKGGATLHGVYLPENTVVGVNSWVLHRNKDVFGEDVHSFRPERWIDGDENKIKEMKRNLLTVRSVLFHPALFPSFFLLLFLFSFVLSSHTGCGSWLYGVTNKEISSAPVPAVALAKTSPFWRCGRSSSSCTATSTSAWLATRSGP